MRLDLKPNIKKTKNPPLRKTGLWVASLSLELLLYETSLLSYTS